MPTDKKDLWDFGIIMFQLLALSHPFASESDEIMADLILKSEPVASMPILLSYKLRSTILSLLDKDPEKRPTTTELMDLPEVRRRRTEQLL